MNYGLVLYRYKKSALLSIDFYQKQQKSPSRIVGGLFEFFYMADFSF